VLNRGKRRQDFHHSLRARAGKKGKGTVGKSERGSAMERERRNPKLGKSLEKRAV